MQAPAPGPVPATVAAVLDAGLQHGAGEALVSRHHRFDFAQLDDQVARAVAVLRAEGVGRGDRVAASTGNHAELVVAFLATMRLGAIWVGINKALTAAEAGALLEDSEPLVLIAERDVIARLPGLPLCPLEAEPDDPTSRWAAALAAVEPVHELPPVDPHAPAAIAYTSGTTGRPKGVLHSQHNLLLPGAVARASRPNDRGRLGVCLPVTILNLVVLGPLMAFQRGDACVLIDRVDPLGLAEWIRVERVTTFAAVPTIIHDLLSHPGVTEDDLRTLTRPGVGGANCPQALRDLYQERYGTRITTGYGLTEAPTTVAVEDPTEPPVPGSCGRALPHVRITIRDDHGSEVPPATTGEVCVGATSDGPFAGWYTPMLGYWRNEAASAAAFWGPVLRTGDLGHLDGAGDLFITDRTSDLILRGGANVYPAEVAQVLSEQPGVAAAAVVGLPDDRLGERVVAAVVADEGAVLDAEVLRAACATRLARYKVPEQVLVTDTLPRNAMGKVVKRDVVALFASSSVS